MKRSLLAASAAALALAITTGCGSSDTSSSGAPPGAPSGAQSGGSAPSSGSAPQSPGTTQGAECENALQLTNTAAEKTTKLSDGEVKVATAWADKGPHPDNTVNYDKELQLMIADFDVPKDKQFGYSIPVGIPDVPDGKLLLSFDFSLPDGKVSEGKTFVGSTSEKSADGKITNFGAYAGSERLLPGDPTVTITKVTDDLICGTISTTTETTLQQFVGIEGSFKADRIQALDAKEAK